MSHLVRWRPRPTDSAGETPSVPPQVPTRLGVVSEKISLDLFAVSEISAASAWSPPRRALATASPRDGRLPKIGDHVRLGERALMWLRCEGAQESGERGGGFGEVRGGGRSRGPQAPRGYQRLKRRRRVGLPRPQ